MTGVDFLLLAGPPDAVKALTRMLDGEKVGGERQQPCLSLPGLTLFAAGEGDLHLLPERAGFVLGRLHGEGGIPIAKLPAAHAANAVTTGGRSLLSSCWGRYVAALSTDDGHAVIRDPAGAIPVYCATRDGVHVYSSRSGAIASVIARLEPDLRFAAHWLAYPYLRTARTGVAGVSELLPGWRRTVIGKGAPQTDCLWSPWDHAAPERRILDFEHAARLLSEHLLTWVPAAVEGKGRLLLELSGGLDSGIVAACLANAEIPFEAANFVTRSADGDERRYARLMAARVGANLTELMEQERPIDLSVPPPTLRPGLSPLVMPLHRAFEAHAASVGADAFVTGAGGDNIFCYLTTAAPVVDAWRDRGVRNAVATTADVVHLNGCTWWTALRLAWAKSRRPRDARGWKGGNEFLRKEAVPARDAHPWLEAPAFARPGQREHVAALLLIQHVLDPEIRHSGPLSIHPLMSQPLMELALRIPSWLWTRGGRNRSVARHAMRDLLPPEILRRSTKGRLEGMCARAFAQSRKEVAELLLAGRLAEHRLLDRPELEAFLREPSSPTGSRYFRVMELAATELWLRSLAEARWRSASWRQRLNCSDLDGSGST